LQGSFGDAQVLQFSFAGGESADDFAERSGASQVAEHQGDQLGPGGHALGMFVGLMLFDGRFEQRTRNEIYNLREYAGYSLHG
jgi:hypothetical protein